jgi:hypothetical protein
VNPSVVSSRKSAARRAYDTLFCSQSVKLGDPRSVVLTTVESPASRDEFVNTAYLACLT